MKRVNRTPHMFPGLHVKRAQQGEKMLGLFVSVENDGTYSV